MTGCPRDFQMLFLCTSVRCQNELAAECAGTGPGTLLIGSPRRGYLKLRP